MDSLDRMATGGAIGGTDENILEEGSEYNHDDQFYDVLKREERSNIMISLNN